ncbi:MAG: zinc ABC transporter substrate-binding protein [Deltaproteobacteria bacterium]|nr:zinc ABC transporter substrate-binding protein [Deltaproteobacteria bacterium]
MRRIRLAMNTAALLLILASPTITGAAQRMPVFVSIAPQAYFVNKIGEGLVETWVMVEPGAQPHTYEPKPKQMIALSRAKIYFAVGIEFETVWLDRFQAVNPDMKIVHTDADIRKFPMEEEHHPHDEKEDRTGGPSMEAPKTTHDQQHTHGVSDPHTWLSPPLALLQSRAIVCALVAEDPAHRDTYEANYRRLSVEILDLDAEIRNIFVGKQRKIEFMVFHPAWGYFARAYGLEQIPVEVEGKEPKPLQLKELIERAKAKNIKVVFVQPQFSTRSADTIANALGGHVAFADPLASDWAKNLRDLAVKFESELR